jgi:hypothetical protein
LALSGPAKHSPAKLSTYYDIHEKRMDQFRAGGFVGEDTVEFLREVEGNLTISGEISCLGDIVIRVEKNLIVIDDGTLDPLVQTVDYAYNASVRGVKSFLRNDNLHSFPGHRDAHHRHDFDWKTEKDLSNSPSWVGEESWPTLRLYPKTAKLSRT